MKFRIFITCLIVFIAAGSAGRLAAQQRVIEKVFEATGDEEVRLNLKFGDTIVVKGWDKNEVSFKAKVLINSGKLNDALLVDYHNDRQRIRIDVDYDEEKIRQGRRSDCPGECYSSYNWNRDGERSVLCSRIVYEIQVPRNTNLVLETISADIEMTGLSGPVEAKSISGFVDLSWPERRGADLSIKTVSGEAYTDLDNLSFRNQKENAPIVGYELKGNIGTGGSRIRLESVSGDVFLRKGKS